nr:MAG TPA: hypothetical protein [Caudoviricetes sp.]
MDFPTTARSSNSNTSTENGFSSTKGCFRK